MCLIECFCHLSKHACWACILRDFKCHYRKNGSLFYMIKMLKDMPPVHYRLLFIFWMAKYETYQRFITTLVKSDDGMFRNLVSQFNVGCENIRKEVWQSVLMMQFGAVLKLKLHENRWFMIYHFLVNLKKNLKYHFYMKLCNFLIHIVTGDKT